MTTDVVSKDLFINYLTDFSKQKPDELKIIVIENAAFLSTKYITLPENIVLLPIPPYCPELNPAERIWHGMKAGISMKIYDKLDDVKNKIDQMINSLEGELIKSITGYEFYLNAFYSIFKD
jgi:transposase